MNFIRKSRTTENQLENFAKKNKINLNGVYSKNQLNNLKPKNGGYIINMQDSNKGNGTHWVCCWIDKNESIYFDSFGIVPPIEIENFIQEFKPGMVFHSNIDIQNINSGGCGQYCMDFLYFMTKGQKKTPVENFRSFIHI
jgi:hypothetical protein